MYIDHMAHERYKVYCRSPFVPKHRCLQLPACLDDNRVNSSKCVRACVSMYNAARYLPKYVCV